MSVAPVQRGLVALVRAYQRWLSPLLGPHCRFAPTCSSYALEALQVHGAFRGSWLAVLRVARCHPFHPGGHDPVPPARSRCTTMNAHQSEPPLTPAAGSAPHSESRILRPSPRTRSRAGAPR